MKNNLQSGCQDIELVLLQDSDREQFIKDNQDAFNYGALEEFGCRDVHFEEDGEIISRKTIVDCLDAEETVAYRIISKGRVVGGLVLRINLNTQHNELLILFVKPEEHGKGIGQIVWKKVESLYPQTKVWETMTPYFEKRNIHFYVNCLGFHITEFYNSRHKLQEFPGDFIEEGKEEGEMFRFIKVCHNDFV